jgi:hypothetical protein
MREGARDAIFHSRRGLLQTITLVAAQSTLACRQADQERRLSIDVLRAVSTVHGNSLSAERLEKIRPALERQLIQLEAVRRFDLEERVEPATVFFAKR